MTYSEKLKDRRWVDFRADFIARMAEKTCGLPLCSQCGEDTADGTLQVHHRKYIDGKEPWDYEAQIALARCKNLLRDLRP